VAVAVVLREQVIMGQTEITQVVQVQQQVFQVHQLLMQVAVAVQIDVAVTPQM
tara:strand:+ start:315 stop:473 length:159 start_codon:yes stop_codon:yes gene_type:complete